MMTLHAALSQTFPVGDLPAAVRTALGYPLRRVSPLAQLAVLGVRAALPAAWADRPGVLLWQSRSGPRDETLALLADLAAGEAPMPYDFLMTQPALAAAALPQLLPGLQAVHHVPLADEAASQWGLLLPLALHWLAEGRYAYALCAQLDVWGDQASGHWLCLAPALASDQADMLGIRLHLNTASTCPTLTEGLGGGLDDAANLPEQILHWRNSSLAPAMTLKCPVAYRQTVEFQKN